MANFLNRARYYATSLAKLPYSRYARCPNCGGSAWEIVDRKYVITALARCADCEILFRQPANTAAELSGCYLSDYRTDKTDTPKNRDPEAYRDVEVLRGVKDASDYIRVLQALGLPKGARVFDYGCSWGYGTAQFRAAGFDMTG